VTCFFIDTAPNVIEYIAAFERMLKPGGYWINLGPLLYHWQSGGGDDDERYAQSVELSYEEIKHVMGTYNFKILVRRHTFIFVHGLVLMRWLGRHLCIYRKSRSVSASTRATSSR
jgi:hypothetical protein